MVAAAAEARAVALEREVSRATVFIQCAARGFASRRRVVALRREREIRRRLPPPEGRQWAARVRGGVSAPGRVQAPLMPAPRSRLPRASHQQPLPPQLMYMAQRAPKAAPPSATAGAPPSATAGREGRATLLCQHPPALHTALRAASVVRQSRPSSQPAVSPSVANRHARVALQQTLVEQQRELSQVRSRRRELEAELAECKAVERAQRQVVRLRHTARASVQQASHAVDCHTHGTRSGAEAKGHAPSLAVPPATEAPRRAHAGQTAAPEHMPATPEHMATHAQRCLAKESGLLWHTLEPPNEHQPSPTVAAALHHAHHRDAGGTAAARQSLILETIERGQRVFTHARRPHAQQIAVWSARA